MRSELVAYVDPRDSAATAEQMRMPRQRSWSPVLEDFVRHRDRKYAFNA